MRVQTLGGLALEGARFTRPKPLLMLAYLALEGAQPRQHLAELFWPAANDRLKSLTVALSRLRQGAPGALRADRQRVWTELPCDAVELLEALQNGCHNGSLEHGERGFLEGVQLPGIGVELEEWIYRTREYLAARVHRARLDLAEGHAAEGRFEEATALAQGALRLVETAPEPEDLVRLHTLLLAGRSPAAAHVRAEANDYGLPLAVSSEAARERLLAASATTDEQERLPLQLPRRATSFVGRDQDLRELDRLVTTGGARVVTLTGPGGVGKTRLALQLAHEQARRGAFAGGVGFVGLAPLRSVAALPAVLLEALGAAAEGPGDPLQRITRAIGERSVLLVCDGFERLMDAASLLATLCEACPNLRLVVTSRERLHVADERVVTVAGLSYPQDAGVDPEHALRSDAVRLFVQRARRARSDFTADAAVLPDVLRVCRAVEGLPLGLELAASWVRAMPVHEIATAIEHDLGVLHSPARDVPEQQRSVSAAFERSWTLLRARERQVLRSLAVFRGGFTRQAAAAVAGASLAMLATLVDKSLLRCDARGRFDRHTLVYQFCQRKLAERPDEARAVAERHAAYYLDLVLQARDALAAGESKPAFDLLESERENLSAAFARLDPRDGPATFVAAIDTLATFFETRNRVHEGARFFDTLRRRLEDGVPAHAAPLASLAVAEARARRYVGDLERAQVLARDALARFAALGDEAGRRKALQVLGVLALHHGDYATATELLEAAAALVGDDDAPLERGLALANLGLARQLAGDRSSAIEHLETALRAFREHGDALREARLLNNLGLLHYDDGNLEGARCAWEQGVALAQRHGNQRDAFSLMSNLGLLQAAMGDHAAAREYDERALAMARALGDRVGEAGALLRRAGAAVAQAALDEAEGHAREAIDIAWRADETPRVLEGLKLLADVWAMDGGGARALELYALVHAHPAATGPVREQAQEAFDRLAEQRPERGASARALAEATSLDALVVLVVATTLPDAT